MDVRTGDAGAVVRAPHSKLVLPALFPLLCSLERSVQLIRFPRAASPLRVELQYYSSFMRIKTTHQDLGREIHTHITPDVSCFHPSLLSGFKEKQSELFLRHFFMEFADQVEAAGGCLKK